MAINQQFKLSWLLDVGENLFELFVGGSEFLAADVEEFFAALGVGCEVVNAALRVLHLLDKLFELGHRLGVSHFVVIFFHIILVVSWRPLGWTDWIYWILWMETQDAASLHC